MFEPIRRLARWQVGRKLSVRIRVTIRYRPNILPILSGLQVTFGILF